VAGRRRARKATATAARRPHTRRGPRFAPAHRGRAAADGVPALRLRSPGPPAGSGPGNGYSRPPASILTARVVSGGAATTCTNRSCSASFASPLGKPDHQAGHAPHLTPLVRHPPPRGPARYPDGAGASQPSRCRDLQIYTHVLNRGPSGVPEPRRWDARRLTRATLPRFGLRKDRAPRYAAPRCPVILTVMGRAERHASGTAQKT
jgi:hypothetical protein